jgi:ABC-type Mn2+/Zn2+ transport system permease subunit
MPTVTELVVPLAMAAAAGLVGAFALMRRMTLASDALSHVALPGIGLAILLRINPVLGGLAALFTGVLIIWALEYRTRLPTEAVIGVIFSAALAIGSMMTSGEELIEALLGAPHAASSLEAGLGLVAAAAVILYIRWARARLVIALISPDLATTAGVDVPRLNLLFLLAFALAVALGLRYLGVLLMGSLIIIPAATAKFLANSLAAMERISVGLAMGATLLGTLLAPRLHVETGPAIIVLAAVGFFLALPLRRVAG